MEKNRREKQRRFHSVSAVVEASFTEGICPDLLHLVELEEDGRSGLTSSMDEAMGGSHPNLSSACRSPILRRCRGAERFPSETSSPGSESPLDSPDGVFRSSKLSPSRFGLFSAIKGRRSSAPVPQQQSPRREVRFFKSDLLAIPEQRDDRRWSAAVIDHAPVRIVVSSSEVELGGGGKLRRRREFGSTGDLLEGSTGLKNSYNQFLGKSMEQVSYCTTVSK